MAVTVYLATASEPQGVVAVPIYGSQVLQVSQLGSGQSGPQLLAMPTTVRPVEGYAKVILGTDPLASVVNADGSITYSTFDVGDAANRAIRVNDVTPIDFQDISSPTGWPVPGERSEGVLTYDRRLRVTAVRQEEWLRRIFMGLIMGLRCPEMSPQDIMAACCSTDGSGNDPLDYGYGDDHQAMEAG